MQQQTEESIFGAVSLGYLVIESNRLREWCRLLKYGLGLHLVSGDDNGLVLRMDNHARRIVLRKGPAEDIVAVGLLLRDETAMAVVLRRLIERGISVTQGDAEKAALRGVKSFWQLKGPKELPIEIFTEPLVTQEPLNMLASGFVTGTSGMGHLALTSRLPEKMQKFWQEIFDARLSDRISQPMAGVMLDVAFLRFNERHHSLAIAATRGLRLDPVRTKVQHMNLLVETLNDLTAAYERCRQLGCEMAHEIGQHPNDRELSFYVLTPSGFEIELGWGALKIQEKTWKAAHYDAISIWGHKPQKTSVAHGIATNLGNLIRGLRNSVRPEYSPI